MPEADQGAYAFVMLRNNPYCIEYRDMLLEIKGMKKSIKGETKA